MEVLAMLSPDICSQGYNCWAQLEAVRGEHNHAPKEKVHVYATDEIFEKIRKLTFWELIFWELTFWEVDILGVDILGVDILGVDILRLTRYNNISTKVNLQYLLQSGVIQNGRSARRKLVIKRVIESSLDNLYRKN